MFDLRYHVASLAAVFIALAVGIVIGVAIASGGGVEDTTKAVLEGDKRRLQDRLEEAQDRIAQSEERQRAVNDLVEQAYPAIMDGRLAGDAVGLLFLGPIDPAVRSAVERTLTDAGAGTPVRVTALELPADPEALLADAAAALCEGRVSLAELRRADLVPVLLGLLGYAQRSALDREAPSHFALPNGRGAPIEYDTQRRALVSARVQEVFGLTATPRLAGGRAPLLFQLLAPNRRPVQITDDLEGFWRRTYAEVRKDLVP